MGHGLRIKKGSQAILLESLFLSGSADILSAGARKVRSITLQALHGSRYCATTGAVAAVVGGSLRTTDVKKARK